ncbi:hypothetical protein SO802_030678 [Lithocarpus litseifolius]|uniref:Uncharacterized protein n=1 Tax=Lithocarpus litseifolius TaxID=425828 RepID=A0AAW2BKM9_9ROSI
MYMIGMEECSVQMGCGTRQHFPEVTFIFQGSKGIPQLLSFTLHDMFGDTTLSSEAIDQLKVHPASKAPLSDICFIEGNGSSLKSLFFLNV